MCSSEFLISIKSLDIEKQPNLYSLLLGEGVFNDLIAIQLFMTILSYESPQLEEMSWISIFIIMKDFLKSTLIQSIIGVLIGLTLSYITKRLRFIAQNVIVECLLVFVVALSSLYLSRMLVNTGVVTLLTTAVTMSHYAWHNLSPQGKHVTSVTFQTVGYCAEALVYCFVGLPTSAIYYENSLNFPFIFLELAIILLSRPLLVFAIYFSTSCCSKSKNSQSPSKLSVRDLVYISYAAFTRGSISFALISRLLLLKMDLPAKKPSLTLPNCFLGSMYFITVVASVVFGALCPLVYRLVFGKGMQRGGVVLESSSTVLRMSPKAG